MFEELKGKTKLLYAELDGYVICCNLNYHKSRSLVQIQGFVKQGSEIRELGDQGAYPPLEILEYLISCILRDDFFGCFICCCLLDLQCNSDGLQTTHCALQESFFSYAKIE